MSVIGRHHNESRHQHRQRRHATSTMSNQLHPQSITRVRTSRRVRRHTHRLVKVLSHTRVPTVLSSHRAQQHTNRHVNRHPRHQPKTRQILITTRRHHKDNSRQRLVTRIEPTNNRTLAPARTLQHLLTGPTNRRHPTLVKLLRT